MSLLVSSAAAFDRVLLDVSLRAALVLAAAWAVASLLLRFRSSAASRHAVWRLAVISVLLLPTFAASLPAWSLPVPWLEPAPIQLDADAPPSDLNRLAELLASTGSSTPLASSATKSETAANSAPTNSPPTGAPEAVLPISPPLSWPASIWLLGASLSIAPTCFAFISLWRLARSSRRVTGGRLHDTLQRMTNRRPSHFAVRLLVSDSRAMPMTWGLWRPTILLPAEAEHWPENRLQIVLRHELAHIERRDCLTQLLAQIARALYWFNPLVWIAERQLRIEQEQACDNIVLSTGCSSPDYAEHLLAVSAACQLPPAAAAVALAMARTSRIERRLRAILDPSENHRPISPRRISLAAAATLVLIAPLSVVHFASTAAAQQQPKNPANNPQPAAAAQPQPRAASIAGLRAEISQHYIRPVDETQMAQGAIKGMIEALRDPYSDFLTPEALAEIEKQIAGTRVGIGAQLEMHENQVRIVTPLDDSPALKAGIEPGDVITQIDGQPTAGLSLIEAVKRITGEQGTTVRLKIARAGVPDLELSVTRAPIKIPTVKGFRRGPDNRWELLLDASQKIGYLSISQFGAATPRELRDAIDALNRQGLKGLILDLRSCPGGSLESAVAVAKQLLASGTIVSLHARGQEPKTITADAQDTLAGLPLVVLINGQTASAAEVLAGALQDNRRAVLLGTRTLGKGSVQTLIKLDEGRGAIKLTTSRYDTPSGRDIDRQPAATTWGINPDEGYFVAANRDQQPTFQTRRQQREIIHKPGARPNQGSPITPASLTADHADPQLAAALKALTARVTTGQFAKVSDLTTAQIEKLLKAEDLEQRRQSVQKNLDQLNRELADLDKEAPAPTK